MPKFSDVARGMHARDRVVIHRGGRSFIECDVVPLLIDADADILRDALAFAKARGLANPERGDDLYELGIWLHTIVRACVDPASPEDAPALYFDSVAQIQDPKKGLMRDEIALLFERQQAFQDRVAPRRSKMTVMEFYSQIGVHAEAPLDELLPFELWQPSMRRQFVRFMAALLSDALRLRSEPGPTFAGAGKELSELCSRVGGVISAREEKLADVIR